MQDTPRPAQIALYGKTTVTATLKGSNVTGDTLSVADLATPMGFYKEASLRTTDVRYLSC
ncbi:hypothetical protein PhCBS80983_g01185 [Powellomyces hirtus]|uniref:Uncharacterized protein n=1 Tax=Powellomyces hirtus TaxID=109895 RepID=A0A507EC44_9FUNG|nr:hypothetical protein PhCBS80983_g01185 [Powellomyces hirtus]